MLWANNEQPEQVFSQTSAAYGTGVLNVNDPIFPEHIEHRHYIASILGDGNQLARIIRSHW